MNALVIIDVQNEFSAQGKRAVKEINKALDAIRLQVQAARKQATPIAWVRHHNKPTESPAFVPFSWGAEFMPGFGPQPGINNEVEFHKDVYGAFTGTDIGSWLTNLNVNAVTIVGFFTHGCVSTTAREALMAGLDVSIDPEATATIAISHELLGRMDAEEVKKGALLQLFNMGVHIEPLEV
jgi:nicotinamidase-related amidase